MSNPLLKPHDVVTGYEVVQELGQGGFGAVYEVYNRNLNRREALKVCFATKLTDEVKTKLTDEVRNHAKLDHPNLVTIYSSFETEHAGQALLGFTMKLVVGTVLSDQRESWPLPLAAALNLIRQVLTALDHVHSKGLIHRDIKPENLIVNEKGNLFVFDFGIAKDLLGPRGAKTEAKGTWAYAAPEQVQGRDVGPETDVYAVATVLFEILTGEMPMTSDSSLGFFFRKGNDEQPTGVGEKLASIPRDIQAVILKGLERKREDRYRTAREMLHALDRAEQQAAAAPTASGSGPSGPASPSAGGPDLDVGEPPAPPEDREASQGVRSSLDSGPSSSPIPPEAPPAPVPTPAAPAGESADGREGSAAEEMPVHTPKRSPRTARRAGTLAVLVAVLVILIKLWLAPYPSLDVRLPEGTCLNREAFIVGRAQGANEVAVAGKRVTLQEDGTFQAAVPLPLEEGPWSIRVRAHADGPLGLWPREDERTINLLVDRVKPVVTVEGIGASLLMDGATLRVSGLVGDATRTNLRVAGEVVAIGDGGRFSCAVMIHAGENEIAIEASDCAGNVRATVLSVLGQSLVYDGLWHVPGDPILPAEPVASEIDRFVDALAAEFAVARERRAFVGEIEGEAGGVLRAAIESGLSRRGFEIELAPGPAFATVIGQVIPVAASGDGPPTWDARTRILLPFGRGARDVQRVFERKVDPPVIWLEFDETFEGEKEWNAVARRDLIEGEIREALEVPVDAMACDFRVRVTVEHRIEEEPPAPDCQAWAYPSIHASAEVTSVATKRSTRPDSVQERSAELLVPLKQGGAADFAAWVRRKAVVERFVRGLQAHLVVEAARLGGTYRFVLEKCGGVEPPGLREALLATGFEFRLTGGNDTWVISLESATRAHAERVRAILAAQGFRVVEAPIERLVRLERGPIARAGAPAGPWLADLSLEGRPAGRYLLVLPRAGLPVVRRAVHAVDLLSGIRVVQDGVEKDLRSFIDTVDGVPHLRFDLTRPLAIQRQRAGGEVFRRTLNSYDVLNGEGPLSLAEMLR